MHRVERRPASWAARHDRVRGRRRAPRGARCTARGRGARAAARRRPRGPPPLGLHRDADPAEPARLRAIGDVGVLSATARAAAAARDRAARRRVRRDQRRRSRPSSATRASARAHPRDPERRRPERSAAAAEERAALRIAPGLPQVAPLVVYTGRLSREKGVDVLVAAWPRVVAQPLSARLWMLGDGADRARAPRGSPRRRRRGRDHPARAWRRRRAVRARGGRRGAAVADRGCRSRCSRRWRAPCPRATAVGGSAEVLRDGTTGRLRGARAPGRARRARRGAPRPCGAAARGRRARRSSPATRSTTLDAFLEVYALRRDGPAAGEREPMADTEPTPRGAARARRVPDVLVPGADRDLHPARAARAAAAGARDRRVSAPRRRARPTSPRGGRDGRAHALPPRPLGRAPRSAASLARAQAARLPARVGPRGPRQPPLPGLPRPRARGRRARHS